MLYFVGIRTAEQIKKSFLFWLQFQASHFMPQSWILSLLMVSISDKIPQNGSQEISDENQPSLRALSSINTWQLGTFLISIKYVLTIFQNRLFLLSLLQIPQCWLGRLKGCEDLGIINNCYICELCLVLYHDIKLKGKETGWGLILICGFRSNQNMTILSLTVMPC